MENYEFKSESKKLLDLMINSIYTNKDIFLRELISNASDALDKIYYKSLTDNKISIDKDELEINISFDKDKRTITIRDNGIGMNKKDLEENLGTIAKSGSLEFKKKMSKEEKLDIIGQFGVGFYSAFMVSDEIIVESKKYNSKDSYIWKSKGIDGYSIDKSKLKDRGTIITLHLKDNDEDFAYDDYLDEYKLKDLIRKYSDYITYPIKMMVTHNELKDEEKHEYEEKKELEVLNSMVPIWKKNEKDVDEAEYDNFYMDKFSDYDKPMKRIVSSVEGITSYKALLFIPSHAPYDYYTENYEKGLALYSNGVMIMEKCSDLLPDYFSFVKGVVDSEDLDLNISREMLQESRSLKLIEKNITSKIKRELETMLKEDRNLYESFFKTFGVQLKYGIYNNFGMDKDKLVDLIMFYSSDKNKLITLDEYVTNMGSDQDKIYYASGSSIDKIESLPLVEEVREKGYDVLLLTDYVDEFAITAIQKYKDKSFMNVESGDFDLDSDDNKKKIKTINTKNKDLLSKAKEIIGDIEEVKFSNRLKDHPVTLTTKGDISIEMQKVFDAMPNDMGIKAQTILEINENHPISKKLKKLYKEDEKEFENYIKILYSEARMVAGLSIDNPVEISDLIADVISK